ncbi:MAG TPA: hypothetical protein PKH77_04380 [Anaerolineae bacterium]|nr:hypothetical protein [Anaerolineae bacterium]
MPIDLLLAYVLFCVGPLGLAISIAIRRRRVRRLMQERAAAPQNRE